MTLRHLIRFYGVLDLCLIGWIVLRSTAKGKMPFFDGFVEAMSAAEAFGQPFSIVLTIGSFILLGTVIFSGLLLIRSNIVGGYLALFQAPFRLIFVLQPTFFFLAWLKGEVLHPWAPIALIVTLEILKTATVVVWIRRARNMEVAFDK